MSNQCKQASLRMETMSSTGRYCPPQQSEVPGNGSRTVLKEGIVNYIVAASLDQECQATWTKCRLALTTWHSATMLEFYSPVKSFKPKWGLFCFLIEEVRVTKPMELPDREFAFVLKSCNHIEYVIEAQDQLDLSEWLQLITHHSGIKQPDSELALNESKDSDKSEWCLINGDYPWFHRSISRNLATQLVLHKGISGNGIFLVRLSESRVGELVLTFNCLGKAKHLRIGMGESGQCHIEHLWFESIFELLEHFRIHSIPFETEGETERKIQLTDFIVHYKWNNNKQVNAFSKRHSQFERRPSQEMTVHTFSGSVKLTTEDVRFILQTNA